MEQMKELGFLEASEKGQIYIYSNKIESQRESSCYGG